MKNYTKKKLKTNLSIEMFAKSTNGHFTEKTRMANKYKERCSTTLIAEKQIKTTVIKTLDLQKLGV